MAAGYAGLPSLSVPDLSILATDYLTPVTTAITGVQNQVTALTSGLAVLDCFAGVRGASNPGELWTLIMALSLVSCVQPAKTPRGCMLWDVFKLTCNNGKC